METIGPQVVSFPAAVKHQATADTPFREILQGVYTAVTSTQSYEAMVQKVTHMHRGEFAQLLQVQVAMHHHALRVEMIAKGVEGISGAVRRLQQG